MSSTVLTPMPHQIEGRDFLLGGGHLLHFDMRTGKTATALWAAQSLGREALPVLVGCPAGAIGIWEAAIPSLVPGAQVCTMGPKTKAMGDWVVCSLDLASRNKDVGQLLGQREWGTLIIDEVHLVSGATTARTAAWLTGDHAIVRRAGRLWMLSGTPNSSNPGQFWAMMHATGHAPESARAFEERYCRHKLITVGSGNYRKTMRVVAGANLARLPELKKRLAGWRLRKRRSDVMAWLPRKSTRVVPIRTKALDPEAVAWERSDEARSLVAQIERGDFSPDPDETGHLAVARYRRLMSAAKGEAAADYVAGLLEAGEPAVVLWFWHQGGMDVAEARLKKLKITVARIDGTTPVKARPGIVAGFQEGKAQVFLGQIQAAGMAIDLTAAGHAVMAEASWIPWHNQQAEDRIIGPAQTRGATIDYLAVKGSIDMAVISAAERRAREAEELEETT
jgi:SWI/SNF-related matrix-associated actin-dependent regulator of chromatin subfamily A-like protein 1